MPLLSRGLSGVSKIIPVVLDNCEVPVVLRATGWIVIRDLSSYDVEMREIVNSIFEYSDKPHLGTPPAYVQAAQVRFADLNKIDSMVLKLIAESAIEEDDSAFLVIEDIALHAEAQDISYEQYRKSLEVLDAKGYIKLHGFIGDKGNNTPAFSLTYYGLERYARVYISNYRSIQMEVISQIVKSWSRWSGADSFINQTAGKFSEAYTYFIETWQSS